MPKIVNEYSDALFSIARENSEEKEYLDSLNTVCDALGENEEFLLLLKSVSIPKEERIKALEAVFLNRVPEYVLSFLALLCERGRINDVFDIRNEFEKLYFAFSNISYARITSAVELSESEKAKLEEKIEKLCSHKIRAEYSIDASLLGGIRVEVDSKVIDGTIKHRLDELKEVMLR